ncbi:putative reverse transcriptase domain, reverse transcriptase zinc-binding domain protein [Tanacetum coccineum]
MHNYQLDRGPPRCAFKVDIKKAYDTVDWNFLRQILIGFGFHTQMVAWIMECVSSTSFLVNLNGSLYGFFKGKRGLRQEEFIFHHHCSSLEIINLCFADDLFLFSHGDINSARVIMDALDEFKNASGLVPSLPKSTAYFCNVLNHIKLAILNVLPFEEDKLPVKYLGIPLVSSRLAYRDFKELVEKSMIASMHVYWSSVFILPSRIMSDIEQLMHSFLWCNGEMRRGKAKVAWEDIFLPKDEGGLGIRRLDHFNVALISSYVWSILTRKESLWVKWGRNFWDYPFGGNMTWGWRKILQIRPIIQWPLEWANRYPLIFAMTVPSLNEDNDQNKINNGKSTSMWFDKWHDLCLIQGMLTARDITRSGFGLSESVSDLIANGNLRPFSVDSAWDSLRSRADVVDWFHVVWFPQCIPRHAFHIWLVTKQTLKTQDTLRQWDVSPTTDLNLLRCPLCDLVPDSHSHLFFECSFST